MCATVLKEHGAEYAQWATNTADSGKLLEIIRAALLLPPPFRDFPDGPRRRLAGLTEVIWARLRTTEAALAAQLQKTREAEEAALAARLDAADAEAALRSAERRVEARAAALEAQVTRQAAELADLRQQVGEVAGLRQRVAELEGVVAARPNVNKRLLRACLAAVIGGQINRSVRRTAGTLFELIKE